MILALITLYLGVKMRAPLWFGVLLSLLGTSFLTTSSTTTSPALSGSSTPMVSRRWLQIGGSLQMSTSGKGRSTCCVRSTGGKHHNTTIKLTTKSKYSFHPNISTQQLMKMVLGLITLITPPYHLRSLLVAPLMTS
uniref:Uncharacterized protein n=1 Tax=Opuntia streptacantha TaxID=393608 RepID=A0A7C9DWW0_OPUST